MEIKRQFTKRTEQHIHSPVHALAEELSTKLNDRKRFAFYLGIAKNHDHNMLRKIAGEVLESKSTKNPGALFAYLVRKNNKERIVSNVEGIDSTLRAKR